MHNFFWGLEGHILLLQLVVFAPLGFILGGLAFRGPLGAFAGALILASTAPALALVLLGGWGNLAAEAGALAYYASPGNATIAFFGGLLLVIQEALRARARKG